MAHGRFRRGKRTAHKGRTVPPPTQQQAGAPAPKKTRKPRVPKAQKLPRPKSRDLGIILKGLITVSIENRIATLSYALQWYDTAVLYAVQNKKIPISPDPKKPTAEQKSLERAVKARNLANGAAGNNEKETALLTAIRQYQTALAALKPLDVDKFFNLYKSKEQALKAKQEKLEQKYGNVVQLLQKAIGERIKLAVADAPNPVQYDPQLSSLSFNREAVKGLSQQFKSEGLLAVFASQLEVLSSHAALESDGKGGWQFDPAKQVVAQQELLQSFVTFAKTADAPKRLVRNGVIPEPKAPRAPGAPRQPGARIPRGGGNMVLGFLIPGTALEQVYQRLKDEQEKDIADVIKGLAIGDPVGRIKRLAQYGAEKGQLKVTITGKRVQLVHLHPQPPAGATGAPANP